MQNSLVAAWQRALYVFIMLSSDIYHVFNEVFSNNNRFTVMSNKVLLYHITVLVATISTSLDAGKVSIACFSDLKKAFETDM